MKNVANVLIGLWLTLGSLFAFSGGDGTVADPYQIATPQDLSDIRNNTGAHYIIVNDLDMSGITFEPLPGITGSLDGQGNYIDHLYIDSSLVDTGLFQTLTGTNRVKNICFTHAEVHGGRGHVGVLAGSLNLGGVENVHVLSGNVYGTEIAGGLIGIANLGVSPTVYDIVNCSSAANVTVVYDYAGVSNRPFAGGLLGAQNSMACEFGSGGSIIDSSSSGKVTLTVNASDVLQVGIGGLVGIGVNGTCGHNIYRSFSGSDLDLTITAPVSAYINVGGLTGYSYQGEVFDTYYNGTITMQVAANSFYVRSGGLIGSTYRGAVSDSYANATADSNMVVSGFIGYNSNGTTVTDSYWNSDKIATSASGTGVSEAELKAPTDNSGIYANWDPSLWNFGTSNDVPAFVWDETDYNAVKGSATGGIAPSVILYLLH